jgi:C1A family cysteine protease
MKKYCMSIQRATTPSNIFVSKITKNIPNIVDLRNKMPPVYDQGNLGSCTANALCAAVQYEEPTLMGSRLFVYYNERLIENDVKNDSGAIMADGVKSLYTYGVCKETSWPYIVNKYNIKPPPTCYDEAKKHKLIQYYSLPNNIIQMKQALISGFPFVVSILVYSSFETVQVATDGYVPMPRPTDILLGGHAILCVGYNEIKKVWIMRNSWGNKWGDKGYFYLPYQYLINPNLASDLWVLQNIV